MSQIEYLAGIGNYSLIHIAGERPILVSRTLRIMAEELPGFIRIHKRTLVNPRHIVDYQRKAGTIRLPNDRSLLISRRRESFVYALLCKP
ncbi:LytTR family transcriptional regulator DNA-binding domain-containing protein [Spirosoma areae]